MPLLNLLLFRRIVLKWGCRSALGLGLVPAAQAQQRAAGPRYWLGCPAEVSAHAPRLVPSLIIDNRNSFVQSSAVRIIGLNVGLTPRGKAYRLGLAAYTLRRDYSQLYTYSGKGKTMKLKDTFSPQLSLTYFTPNFAYTFFNRRFIELSIPVDIGLGRSHYTVTDEKGNVTTDNKGLFFPAEIGFGVLLKPTRWVGLSGSVGYRVSLKEIDYKEDFDGWYYGYRLNLFVGHIWHDWQRYHHARQAWRAAHPEPPDVPTGPDGIGNP